MEAGPAPETLQKDRKRCYSCNKKVGLLGNECKCRFVFCNMHRLPEDHSCDYDYRQKAQQELSKKVVGTTHDKIEKI